MLIKLSLKYNSRKIYLRLLNILMYPSGYSTSNLLLIISIIIGALGAALVRIIGLESLFLVLDSYQSNNLFILGLLLTLLVFNTIYLKVIPFPYHRSTIHTSTTYKDKCYEAARDGTRYQVHVQSHV